MFTRRSFLIASAVTLALGRESLQAAHAANASASLGFKLFDAHCHLRTDDTAKYPRGTQSNGQGPPPGSANGPPPPSGESPSIDAVLRWMDESGVEGGAAVQHRGTYGFDNRYILDSADAHKERLVPVCVLNAEDPATPAQVRGYVRDHGLAGVRLTGPRATDGSFPWLSSPQALQVWAVANELGLVIDVMTTPPGETPGAIAEFSKLARQFPKARLVLDHVGWLKNTGAPDFGMSAEQVALKAQKNIYYKFSTINIDQLVQAKVPPEDVLRHVVDVYGADHVLWGSDIGNSAGPYSRLVEGILAASSKLTINEKHAVLHDTGKRVYARGGSLG